MRCSFCKSEGRPVVKGEGTAAICRECADICIAKLSRHKARATVEAWALANGEQAVEPEHSRLWLALETEGVPPPVKMEFA